MNVCVFLGPTLSRAEARAVWDEPLYLPPVRQGDLYAVARRRPAAIGIVDGYFEGVPSVWHKEILWAMAQGIHVYGASSMGALRAAELAAFGMRGVGEVYASLARGDWEDDDEVAILHGPAELGYPALSDAMVDIRATVERARVDGVVDTSLAERFVARAKARPYAGRSYASLLRDLADDADVEAAALESFRRWLPDGRVSRKARDAVQLLESLRESAEELAVPLRVDYRFERTEAWRHVVERTPDTPTADAVEALALELIKLDGTWRERAPAALLRHALSFRSGSGEDAPDPARLGSARDMLRRSHELWCADVFAEWKEANGLDEPGFSALLESEARVAQAAASVASLDPFVVRDLQASGDYARYRREAERMRARAHALEAERSASSGRERAAPEPALADLLAGDGVDVGPDHVTAYARSHGFVDADALRRALLRRDLTEPPATPTAGDESSVVDPPGTA